jgi:hypothetical protein
LECEGSLAKAVTRDKLNAIAFDAFASLQAARTSEDLRIVNYAENLQEADIENELDYPP